MEIILKLKKSFQKLFRLSFPGFLLANTFLLWKLIRGWGEDAKGHTGDLSKCHPSWLDWHLSLKRCPSQKSFHKPFRCDSNSKHRLLLECFQITARKLPCWTAGRVVSFFLVGMGMGGLVVDVGVVCDPPFVFLLTSSLLLYLLQEDKERWGFPKLLRIPSFCDFFLRNLRSFYCKCYK